MYSRLLRNDILKSKAITLTTMLFVAVAAMLVALARGHGKETDLHPKIYITRASGGA